MVDYVNCRFQPVSAVQNTPTQITVKLVLQTGTRTTFVRSGLVSLQRLGFYARWRDGEDAPNLLHEFGLRYHHTDVADSINSIEIELKLNPNQINILNSIDTVSILSGANLDTYTFNRYDYLIKTGPSLYGSRLENQITNFSTFSTEVTAQDGNSYTAKLTSSYNNTDYDIYLTDITNVEDLVIEGLPHLLPLGIEILNFTGVVNELENIRYELTVGRISARNPAIISNPTVIDEIVNPSNPVVPQVPTFEPSIVSVELLDGGFVQANYDITPIPTAAQFTSLELRFQVISNSTGGFQSRTTFNHATRSLVALQLLDGESIRLQVAMKDINDFISRSQFYVYTLSNGTLILDNSFYDQATVKATKIHVTKVRATTLDLLLINDIFNDEFVTSVTITVQGEQPENTQTIENTFMTSNIEVSLDNLLPDTAYTIIITALANNMSFEIQRIGVMTTILIAENATPEEKEKQGMQQIIRMAYDNDTIESIEVLEKDDMGVIGRNVLTAILEPDQLGIVYDRNKSNRKGSVYNAGNSDTVTHNYPKTIEQILATNSIGIPDIDEGYN